MTGNDGHFCLVDSMAELPLLVFASHYCFFARQMVGIDRIIHVLAMKHTLDCLHQIPVEHSFFKKHRGRQLKNLSSGER